MSCESKSLKEPTVNLYKLAAFTSDTLKNGAEKPAILTRIVDKLAPRLQLPHLQ